jgi:cation diffusion facilitator CzcD-associated flavoprotein CzcO
MTVATPSAVLGQAVGWLSGLEAALADETADGIAALFLEDCHWRDIAAFTWDVFQTSGIDSVGTELLLRSAQVGPTDFALDPARPAPGPGTLGTKAIVEVFFIFRTKHGAGRGLAYLSPDDTAPQGVRCLVLSTVLTELAGVARKYDGGRDPGHGYAPRTPGQTWTEFRAERLDYADRDPDVLVVGGGQAGVCVAAQLDDLGVDALVVDRHERAGDSWRKRYATLALHTPTDMSDFPFIPFPKTFPKYLSKDKYADWIESYVRLMDLNYWTETEFLGAEYDPRRQRWTARVRRAGELRTLHSAHVVMAVGGAGGRANLPALPGLDSFEGKIVHSSRFTSAAEHAGSRAVVVGVGTSGHDIALDLYHHGADVTMIQRGPISVVDVDSANVVFADYFSGMPQDEADQRAYAKYPLQRGLFRAYTDWTQQQNASLLQALERAGMRLDLGEDGTGWPMKFIRYAGGYYLNVGASDVIADGGIGLLSYDDFETFTPTGLRRTDGTEVPLDVVVMATGYENLASEVRALFGTEVADRVGRVGGLDLDGERLNFCKPTAQEHLWFIYGGIIEGRRSACWMALMIKAQLAGFVPSLHRGPDGRLTPLG